MTADLAAQRAWYAQDLALRAPIRRNPAITEAFATVPREKFLGPAPWRLMPDARPDLPFTVPPDGDPGWLYHDVLVSIDLRATSTTACRAFGRRILTIST